MLKGSAPRSSIPLGTALGRAIVWYPWTISRCRIPRQPPPSSGERWRKEHGLLRPAVHARSLGDGSCRPPSGLGGGSGSGRRVRHPPWRRIGLGKRWVVHGWQSDRRWAALPSRKGWRRVSPAQAAGPGIGRGSVGHFLDRMDAVYGHTPLGVGMSLKEKPSTYSRDRCWVSCDPTSIRSLR